MVGMVRRKHEQCAVDDAIDASPWPNAKANSKTVVGPHGKIKVRQSRGQWASSQARRSRWKGDCWASWLHGKAQKGWTLMGTMADEEGLLLGRQRPAHGINGAARMSSATSLLTNGLATWSHAPTGASWQVTVLAPMSVLLNRAAPV